MAQVLTTLNGLIQQEFEALVESRGNVRRRLPDEPCALCKVGPFESCLNVFSDNRDMASKPHWQPVKK